MSRQSALRQWCKLKPNVQSQIALSVVCATGGNSPGGSDRYPQGRIADYMTRLDFVLLDELGYLPFAQAGG
jgi:hypothetical protein